MCVVSIVEIVVGKVERELGPEEGISSHSFPSLADQQRSSFIIPIKKGKDLFQHRHRQMLHFHFSTLWFVFFQRLPFLDSPFTTLFCFFAASFPLFLSGIFLCKCYRRDLRFFGGIFKRLHDLFCALWLVQLNWNTIENNEENEKWYLEKKVKVLWVRS